MKFSFKTKLKSTVQPYVKESDIYNIIPTFATKTEY